MLCCDLALKLITPTGRYILTVYDSRMKFLYDIQLKWDTQNILGFYIHMQFRSTYCSYWCCADCHSASFFSQNPVMSTYIHFLFVLFYHFSFAYVKKSCATYITVYFLCWSVLFVTTMVGYVFKRVINNQLPRSDSNSWILLR